MSKQNDGKYLEDAIEAELKKIKDVDFRYRRLPDAKAARGLIQAQPADYMFSTPESTNHLECKSVGGKTYRLPMFSQWAEMADWDRAGVSGIVFIHFHVPNVFCVEAIRKLKTASSWSFKGHVKYKTVKEALRAVLGGRLPE